MIKKPTFIINQEKVIQNINFMINKANQHHLIFRPHFKTHNSIEIADIYRQLGVSKCTVSSVEMAKKFAYAGWDDITIAFPYNPLEIREINELNAQKNLNLLVDNSYSIQHLNKYLKEPISIFIEINTGKNRSGRNSEDIDIFKSLISEIKHSEKINFKGILTHAGHSYNTYSIKEINVINRASIEQMNLVKKLFLDDFDECLISIGDTPTAKLCEDFSCAHEFRPGVFVYYDLMMEQLGVCKTEDIAAYLAAPIVGIYPERKENNLLVYCGAVHLSKDSIIIDGHQIFGRLVVLNNSLEIIDFLESPVYLTQLSQEHAMFTVPRFLLDKLKIGKLIGVLPVHACLTANILSEQLIIKKPTTSADFN